MICIKEKMKTAWILRQMLSKKKRKQSYYFQSMYKALAVEIWKPNREEFKPMFFGGKTRDRKLDEHNLRALFSSKANEKSV